MMRFHNPLQSFAFSIAGLFIVAGTGCGGDDYQVVPVSGRVMLDGKPLADVGLSFVPLARDRRNPNVGPGSLGKTDAEGRFQLQTIRGEDGAVPAEHIVRMMLASKAATEAKQEDTGPEDTSRPTQPSPRVRLPRNASDGSIHFIVPLEGTDQAHFDLVSQ